MQKRIVISAGGSGGHLFPAQALADELIQDNCDVLFIGEGLAHNPYFQKKRYPFLDISSATLSGKNPLHYLKGFGRILIGIIKSYWALRRFKPHTVVGFGSYQTVPALLAAKLLSTSIILHEANAVPGKVNRLLSPYVCRTAITFNETSRHLRGRSSIVEFPCRHRLKVTREEALDYYGLEKDRLTLLIFGGSQGARKLNQTVTEAITQYLQSSNLQVLHFSGRGNSSEEIAVAYEKAGIPSVVKPFEHHMEYAWTLADFCISRAGASSIMEQKAYAVPGILIPYPYATDDHQAKNALAFIEETGGAEMIRESEITPQKLGERIKTLCTDISKRFSMKGGIEQSVNSQNRDTLRRLLTSMTT